MGQHSRQVCVAAVAHTRSPANRAFCSGAVAWCSASLILNIAIYLKWWEWYGWGWQWEWALVLMLFLGILAFTLLATRSDVPFAMATVWVLAGVVRVRFAHALPALRGAC